MWLANVPVYAYWLWFSLRARHVFFFSNVNPAIPLSGAVGESKRDILLLLPPEIVGNWVFATPGQSFDAVQKMLDEAGIQYPLVAKPDIGERGFLVKVIDSPAALKSYLEAWPISFILQEFLPQPQEASVLFHRFPGEDGRFAITSVCLKAFLRVRGDGSSSIWSLMQTDARAAFQIERFEQDFPDLLQRIPENGEDVLLEPIGNHIRGTKFLDGGHLIDAQMTAAFEAICRRIPGVTFGRFDLKFQDVESLKNGVFKTMELNGVFSEPAHVFDPDFGMFRAYKVYWQHWKLLFQLHRAQKRLGISPTPTKQAVAFIQGYLRYKRRLTVDGRR
jgi:hypothetical protein